MLSLISCGPFFDQADIGGDGFGQGIFEHLGLGFGHEQRWNKNFGDGFGKGLKKVSTLDTGSEQGQNKKTDSDGNKVESSDTDTGIRYAAYP